MERHGNVDINEQINTRTPVPSPLTPLCYSMQEANDPLNMVCVTAVHSGMEAQSTRHRVKKMIKSNNQFSNND